MPQQILNLHQMRLGHQFQGRKDQGPKRCARLAMTCKPSRSAENRLGPLRRKNSGLLRAKGLRPAALALLGYHVPDRLPQSPAPIARAAGLRARPSERGSRPSNCVRSFPGLGAERSRGGFARSWPGSQGASRTHRKPRLGDRCVGRTQLRKKTVTRLGPSDQAPPRTILYWPAAGPGGLSAGADS